GDEARSPGLLIVAADTAFNDNDVLLDGPGAGEAALISAVTVISFGDVAFEGNQCKADLGSAQMWFDALVMAWSLRVADNRFQETFGRAAFSAVTLAPMNCTTDNQGTHCFAILYTGPFVVSAPNRTLSERFPWNPCPGSVSVFGDAMRKLGWTVAQNG